MTKEYLSLHIHGHRKDFSQGGSVGVFPKFFPGGGPNVVKFVFYPSKLKKQPFLLIISKSRGLCPPSDAHVHVATTEFEPDTTSPMHDGITSLQTWVAYCDACCSFGQFHTWICKITKPFLTFLMMISLPFWIFASPAIVSQRVSSCWDIPTCSFQL